MKFRVSGSEFRVLRSCISTVEEPTNLRYSNPKLETYFLWSYNPSQGEFQWQTWLSANTVAKNVRPWASRPSPTSLDNVSRTKSASLAGRPGCRNNRN